MTTLPRLLVLMGSGETSPTMVKTHREVLARLGPPPVPAVLLDTPYGFQANADDLSARAVGYFADSVGQPVEVVRFRSAEEIGTVGYESSLARLREARFVFAGPGSPSYALRQWRASGLVPEVLGEKLTSGGCLTFASAAALTVGVVTVPVYEIYKVGHEPVWLDGLDLLGAATGLRAAVIPHFNNAEGGTHDTRYCYLGEDRLRALEEQLPEGGFVLGIDEHTGLVLDLDAGCASVVGLGGVTVRVDGRASVVPAGEIVDIASLGSAGAPSSVVATTVPVPTVPDAAAYPLVELAEERNAAFTAALAAGDLDSAVQAVLDLEAALEQWAADTPQSDERDRARAVLRSMIVRLGALARTGTQDPRAVVGPYVEALLDERTASRADRRWDDADRVRDRLVDLGIEVRDSPTGTEWDLGGGG
jgi:hypothetical protein